MNKIIKVLLVLLLVTFGKGVAQAQKKLYGEDKGGFWPYFTVDVTKEDCHAEIGLYQNFGYDKPLTQYEGVLTAVLQQSIDGGKLWSEMASSAFVVKTVFKHKQGLDPSGYPHQFQVASFPNMGNGHYRVVLRNKDRSVADEVQTAIDLKADDYVESFHITDVYSSIKDFTITEAMPPSMMDCNTEAQDGSFKVTINHANLPGLKGEFLIVAKKGADVIRHKVSAFDENGVKMPQTVKVISGLSSGEWTVDVTDLAGGDVSCRTTITKKQLVPKGSNLDAPNDVYLFVKPDCTTPGKYTSIFAVKYSDLHKPNQVMNFTIKQERREGGTTKLIWDDSILVGSATDRAAKRAEPSLYENGLRSNPNAELEFYQGASDLREGDIITISSGSLGCGGGTIRREFVVKNPFIGKKLMPTTANELTGTCDGAVKALLVGVYVDQYYSELNNLIFSRLCDGSELAMHVRQKSVSGYVGNGTNALVENLSLKAYNPWRGISSTVKVTENGTYRFLLYSKQKASDSQDTPYNAVSEDFNVNSINSKGFASGEGALSDVQVQFKKVSVLEGRHGIIAFSGFNEQILYTKDNPLTISIYPSSLREGSKQTISFGVTGPSTLATEGNVYNIDFPVVIKREKAGDFSVADLPSGQYRIEMNDGCYKRTISFAVPEPTVKFDVSSKVMKVCDNKADVRYTIATTNVDYWLNNLVADLFKDGAPNNDDIPLSKRLTGNILYKAQQKIQGNKVELLFKDLSPGDYIVRVNSIYQDVISPVREAFNGYMAGESGENLVSNKNWNNKTYFYYKLTLVPPTENRLIVTPIKCSDNQVSISVDAGANVLNYPITYTLYSADLNAGVLENEQIAIDNTGTPVQSFTLNSEQQSRSTLYSFNSLPNLAPNKVYIVRYTNSCSSQDYVVDRFETVKAEIKVSETEICAGNDLTLDIDLPENVYNIEWKSDAANVPSGVSRRKKATLQPRVTAKYWAEYSLKSVANCTNARFETEKVEVTIKDDGKAPEVYGLVPTNSNIVEMKLTPGLCDMTHQWEHVRFQDSCLASVTWKVVSGADGRTIYTPPTDALGNSIGNSWQFPLGESKVVYTASDVSGKTTEHSFTVNILPTILNLNTNNTYVDDTGAELREVKIGGKLNYKVTLNNNTQKNVKDVVINVTLPDNAAIELPAVADVDITSLQTTALKATVATVTRPDNGNTYVIQNIDPTIFVAGSGQRSILFPIRIKEECEGLSDACSNLLKSRVVVTFKGEVNCPQVGQVTEIKEVSMNINTDECIHGELLCAGSAINLSAEGTGFTSWKWFLNDVELPGGDTQTYRATEPGRYVVKRKATCEGQEVESTQIIRVYSKAPGVAQEESDPIRATAQVGAYCPTDFVWTSHFYLCEGTTRQLEIDYHSAQRVVWERYTGQETGLCLPRTSGWNKVSESRTFNLLTAGSYRLRVEADGCTDTYYFDVFTRGIEAKITTRDVSDTGSGSIDIEMQTKDIPYIYKLIHGNSVIIEEKVSDEGANVTSRHIFAVQGIDAGTSRTYTLEVTSPTLKGCVFTEQVMIQNTSTLKATVSNAKWAANCEADFDFEVQGSGTTPYRVAIYSIDGEKLHKDERTGIPLALADIPEDAFKTPMNASGQPSTARSFTLRFPVVALKGKYSFVIKDRNSAKIIETNTIDIPNSSDDFTINVEYNNGISPQNPADASAIRVTADNGQRDGKFDLYRINADGTEQRVGSNTGLFSNISAGDYEVRVTTGAGCVLKKAVKVEKQTSGLKAYVGIKVHNSCDTDLQNRSFTAVINNVTGGSGNYEYAFVGETYGASPEGKVYSSGVVSVKDKVTNAKLELPITTPLGLQSPTWVPNPADEIVYDCEGNAVLTPRITAPVGQTYNYVYEYFDSHIGKTVRTAIGTEKLLLRPKAADTGASGPKSDGHKITVYYEDAVNKVQNILFADDFGDGYNDCLEETTNGVRFNPVAFTCAANMTRGLTSSGSYMITKALPASEVFSAPESGVQLRYLAVATSGVSDLLYARPLKGIQSMNSEGSLQKVVKVSFKYASLLPQNSTKSPSPVIVEIVTPTRTYSKRFDALSNGTNTWKETGEMSFNLSGDAITASTPFQFRIRGAFNSGIAIDDIKVYQVVPSCGQKIDVTIPVEAGHSFFGDESVIVLPPRCPEGTDATIMVTMYNTNNKPLQGSIDRGKTWIPLVQEAIDKPEAGSGSTGQKIGSRYRLRGSDANPIKAGSYPLMVRSDAGCSYRFENPIEVKDPEPLRVDTDRVVVSPIGCESNYKVGTVMFPILGGTRTENNSYNRLLWRMKGEGNDKWNRQRAGVPIRTEFTTSVGVVRGVIPGQTYEFMVIDGKQSAESDEELMAKMCNLEPIFTYTIPSPTPITANVEYTTCYSGRSDGFVKVSITGGGGGYQFSIDGGNSFLSASADSPNEQEFTGLDSGTYKLVVKDQYGCSLKNDKGEEGMDITIPDMLVLSGSVLGEYSCTDATPHETIELTLRGRIPKMEHTIFYRKGLFGEYRILSATKAIENNATPGTILEGTDGALKQIRMQPTREQVIDYRTNGTPLPNVVLTLRIEADDVYFFKFRDENGCETEPLQFVIGPNKPEWQSGMKLKGSTIACAGQGVGYIGVDVGDNVQPRRLDTARDIKYQKGTPPYYIDVFKDAGNGTRGQKMLGQNNLPAGKYVAVIRDGKGCESEARMVEVFENLAPDLSNVTTQGETCNSQGTQYGSVMYIVSGGGTPPFRVSLHTESGSVARDITSVGSSAFAIKENVSAGSSNTFGGLTAGKYTLRVFDKFGCKTEKELNITGAVDKLRVEPQPTNNCNKASVKLTAYKSGNANINGNVSFAVYKGERLSDIRPVQGATIDENGKKVVTITIDDLEPGAIYSYYVVSGGCKTVYDPTRYNTGEDSHLPKAMQTSNILTTKSVVKGMAVCGAEKGKISFKLTDIPATTTKISYEIYRYPDGAQAGNGGTAIPLNGATELSYTEERNSLEEGQYYVVFNHEGIGCRIASEPFTITTSGSPVQLFMEKLGDAASSETACHDTDDLEGWLRIWTEGGQSPFKYVVTKNATVPANIWDNVQAINSTFMQTDHRSHMVYDEAKAAMVPINSINYEATTWYVHVQDALGCMVTKDVTIDIEPGAILDKNPTTNEPVFTPGNLCASNGEYTLEVKMESVGVGLHTYELKGENNRSRTAITFQTGADGKQYFTVPHLRSSKKPQYIIIRDADDCYDKKTPTNADSTLRGWEFKIPERISYNLEISKPLSCMTGGAKNGYISIKGLGDKLDPNKTYSYRSALIKTSLMTSLNPQTGAQETNVIEVETNPRSGRISNPNEERIEVEAPGLYYVYVYEDGNADCPIKQQITVPEPAIPFLRVINSKDEECTNSVGIGSGEGIIGVTATGEGLSPFKFKIVSAVDLTNNQSLNYEPRLYEVTTQYAPDGVTAIPTSTNTAEVFGDMAVFKKLKGTYAGVRYGIQAVGNENTSKCESNILYVDIRAPKPIVIAKDAVTLEQFTCEESSLSINKGLILIDPNKISGGKGNYTYIFKEIVSGVTITKREPFFAVGDRKGGRYQIFVRDENGCEQVYSELVNPNRPYSLDNPHDSSKPITLEVKEFVAIEKVEVTQVLAATCSNQESIEIKVTTFPANPSSPPKFKYVIHSDDQRVTLGEELEPTTDTVKRFDGLRNTHFKIIVTNVETGCEAIATYSVYEPNDSILQLISSKDVSCNGGSDGAVTLQYLDERTNNGDFSREGFTYEISNLNGTIITTGIVPSGTNIALVEGLKAGNYRARAVSAKTGCKTISPASFIIRQAELPLEANAVVTHDASCTNEAGEIQLEIRNGKGPYDVTVYRNGNALANPVKVLGNVVLFENLGGGDRPGEKAVYTFSVMDAWGCTQLANPIQPVELIRPSRIESDAIVTPTSCMGTRTGKIEVDLTKTKGGSGNYFFTLEEVNGRERFPAQRSPIFENLPAGEYIVRVTDKWECGWDSKANAGKTYTVTDAPEIVVEEVEKTLSLCADEVDGGFVTVKVSGGIPNTNIDKLGYGGKGYRVELISADSNIVKQRQFANAGDEVTFRNLIPRRVYRIQVIDGGDCARHEPFIVEIASAPDLTTKAIQILKTCQDNSYMDQLEVEFAEIRDAENIKYVLEGDAVEHAISFDRYNGNYAYIDDPKQKLGGSGYKTIDIIYQTGTKTCKKTSLSFLVPDVQELELIQSDKVRGLINQSMFVVQYGVPPYQFYFNGIPALEECDGETHTIETVNHELVDGQCSNTAGYRISPSDPETIKDGIIYKRVQVAVEDGVGCRREGEYLIMYSDIEIPPYFTPDGSNFQDTWGPENVRDYPNLTTTILDRYGRILKVLKWKEKWDGNYDGKPMPTGDYWYIIQLNSDVDDREFKGHFTLFR